jgi:Rrf2 family protein
MPFISTGVEYGLHSLVYLVDKLTDELADEFDDGLTHEAGSVKEASVNSLAQMQGISAAYLAKLFTKLRKAGLVRATEGIHGGFALARPAGTITVAQVVDAIDGNAALFKCRNVRSRRLMQDPAERVSATRHACTIHAAMQLAEQCIRDELRRHTLADLARHADVSKAVCERRQIVRWRDEKLAMRKRA